MIFIFELCLLIPFFEILISKIPLNLSQSSSLIATFRVKYVFCGVHGK